MPTITVKNRPSFESPHDDNQVTALFLGYAQQGKFKGNFPADLASGIRRYGRPTLNQLPWVHFFVHEVETPHPVASGITTGLKSIVDHLQGCLNSRLAGGKGLLNPKVMVSLDGQTVALKLCGPKSKYKGKVSIASSPRFGQGEFYGYIEVNGTYEHRNRTNPKVLALLERIAVDPPRVISELGRESGTCCYCFLQLTTVQSKIAGCGPDCSEHYGTWYPSAAETRDYLTEHPGVLDGATDRARWL
jgi:hypothetical protein